MTVRSVLATIHAALAAAPGMPPVYSPPMKLWIVGRAMGSGAWDFQGVFSSQALAFAACRDETYFVGEATLDEQIPHEREDWPVACYPLAPAGDSTDEDPTK